MRIAASLLLLLAAASCSLTTDLEGLSGKKKAAAPELLPDGGVLGNSSDAGGDAGGGTIVSPDGATPPKNAYAAAVLADRPVAYYPMDDAAGSMIAIDVVGGRNANQIRGASGFGSEGAVGTGYATSTNTGFEVADVFDFAGKVPFTFEMWIKPSFTGNDLRLISKRKENINPILGYIVYIKSDNGLQFENWGVGLSAWTDNALPPATAGFTHVVLAISYATGKGNTKLYINGVGQKAGAYDNTDDAADTDQPLRFIENYRGAIDEIAIYDKALAGERVLAHYRAVRP
jgi:hypothetical protein